MGHPNLDVRLTRSQSGSILDIDFVGVLGIDPSSASAAQMSSSTGPLVSASLLSSHSMAVVPTGRRLKILEHRVHKVEMRTKETGEQEEELVVSNLRPFTLKVGVHDHLDQPILDCSLPLRASLLYENGLPVKQTSTSEPLLVGETDVVALQGAATFKLRITSLSSHRDKQRFRIQVAPQDVELQLNEGGLCIVTDPMKSVTKLGRATGSALMPPPPPPPLNDPSDYRQNDALKRKYADILESQAEQLRTLTETQQHIQRELQSLLALAHQRALNGGASVATRRTAGVGI
ncbi:hypothetical protein Ctob_010497 [Chrysochromulina tobinii]|uniref:Uncharacterized protein n=1 Tax=Chrysochromulina tobinii TaxID=1460289 RepID=A0A0M0JWQ9_9EUKA|nr:hypothetical protein Ctob_010497 [Chrysochromulina tobinii]|eukprot:KOO30578.1 hypothetical protein Ctob_010497 [Chrysochromulina sp. CCMP291]